MKHEGKIRILIVDDSVLFRSQIQLALQGCNEIEIVGAASNGKIALDKIATNTIDLITLDLEMPVMDGIETIKAMKERGMKSKVILFSSASRSGAEKTLEAMHLGAIDFVAKPQPDGTHVSPADKIRDALLPKILSLFGYSQQSKPVTFRQDTLVDGFKPEVLVIASSTGGPNALVDFFGYLKDDYIPYPILIAQHMPPVFTASLAERLGVLTGKVAKEGVHGEILQPNQIYVAPGNFHMKIGGTRISPMIQLDQGPQRNYVRPCADFLFESAVNIYGKNILGIVLTGMGRDGADGAQAIKQRGGTVMIQDEASSVVFGMPGAVFESKNYNFMGTPKDLAFKTLFMSVSRKGGNVA